MDDFIARRARPQIFNLKEYVAGKPIAEVKRELGLDDVIKMASNENPLGPSPLAIQAVMEHLGEMHFYPDGSCRDLKEKLASRLQINPDCLIIGNGSDEILKLIATAFINPGDEVILPQPTFSEYEFCATVMGAVCRPVPLVNNTHDLTGMLGAINAKTKLIFICNPNNPTGTVVSAAALDEFMDRVPQDILVVIDEAYSEYVENPDYGSGQLLLGKRPQTIILRTFSKLYGLAALRLGYGIGNPAIISALGRVKEPFNVNSLAQHAGMAALDDEKHIAQSLGLNRSGKDYLYQALAALGLAYTPTEANFIFVDTGQDAGQVFQGMLRLGVIIRSCDVFGCPTAIRVTIGTAEQNQRFVAALQSVMQEIKG
ncbi:MAG: histidinol-phosphate transaminase [Syntrophomonadaceae bacterium]|jgi:histidinol-phosphate aminotransferase